MNLKKLLMVFAIGALLHGCVMEEPQRTPAIYPLSSQELEQSFGNTDELLQVLAQKPDFTFDEGKQIDFASAQKVFGDKNLVATYSFPQKTYKLFALGSQNQISDNFEIRDEKEAVLFKGPMCYAADGPVIDFRLVEGLPAITYSASCGVEPGTNIATGVVSILYNGQTFQNAHYLFSYKNKLGYVTKKDNHEYIFYNGKIVSDEYDLIPTSMCCATITPLFRVYDNGALLFRAQQGQIWLVREIDLADEGILKGYEDGCFHPNNQITRAEFVKMVMMATGMDPKIMTTSQFRDVTTQMQWYDNYVLTAADAGLVKGYSDGTFRPNSPITRAEAIQMLYNLSGTLKQVNTLGQPVSTIISFKDVHAGDWFMPAVAGAYHAGLVQGDKNRMFNPNRNLIRAEAAKIIKLFWAVMRAENGTNFQLLPPSTPMEVTTPAPVAPASNEPYYGPPRPGPSS